MTIFTACLLSAALVFVAISFAVLASAIWQARSGRESVRGFVAEEPEPVSDLEWDSAPVEEELILR